VRELPLNVYLIAIVASPEGAARFVSGQVVMLQIIRFINYG
jgi:hypothetical protein